MFVECYHNVCHGVVCIFQYQVRAVDNGEPALTGQATVRVNVLRDLSQLRFLNDPYNGLIPDSADIDFSILTAVTNQVVR